MVLLEETYRRVRVFIGQLELGDTDMVLTLDNSASAENPTPELWWTAEVTDSSGVVKATAGLTGTYDKTTGKLTLANGGSFTWAQDDIATVICSFYTTG